MNSVQAFSRMKWTGVFFVKIVNHAYGRDIDILSLYCLTYLAASTWILELWGRAQSTWSCCSVEESPSSKIDAFRLGKHRG